jgi:hypothetical protein
VRGINPAPSECKVQTAASGEADDSPRIRQIFIQIQSLIYHCRGHHAPRGRRSIVALIGQESGRNALFLCSRKE